VGLRFWVKHKARAEAGVVTKARPGGFGILMHVLIHSGTPELVLKITRTIQKRLIYTYTH
jgi:hypothetical protein